MQTTEQTIFNLQLDEHAISGLLGVLPFEIIMILRESYPDGKVFKELKKGVEERLQDWLSKKNKSNSFTDQAIYYQLRKLRDFGFIETISEKEPYGKHRVTTSQKYKLTSLQYVINFSEFLSKKNYNSTSKLFSESVQSNFLHSFSKNGKFNGFIVIGTGSHDAPFIGNLSFLLAKYFDLTIPSFVTYDSSILDDSDDKKVKEMLSQNLILLGGPNVNRVFHATVVSQSNQSNSLNDILPVKFVQAPDSGIIIQKTNKTFLSKYHKVGVIQIIDNPWNPKNKILTIGGSRMVGTAAAVTAFIDYFESIDKILLEDNYCLIEAQVDSKNHIVETKILQD